MQHCYLSAGVHMLYYSVWSRCVLRLVIRNRRQCAFEYSIVELQGVSREYTCKCDLLVCVNLLVRLFRDTALWPAPCMFYRAKRDLKLSKTACFRT